MDNNQFNGNGQISPNKLLEYIGVGFSFLGALIGFIFSIVTCSRGYQASNARAKMPDSMLKMSYAWIGVLIAVIIMIAGIVLIIISKEKGAKLSKLATIGLIVAAAATIYVVLVHTTICSYNCSINSYISDKYKSFY